MNHLESTLVLIQQLRDLADHLELHGPTIVDWDSGTLTIERTMDVSRVGDELPGECIVRSKSLRLFGDISFSNSSAFHPRKGLKPVFAKDRTIVRWNGEMPRRAKRGEYCITPQSDAALGSVRKARTNYNLLYFIFDEVSDGRL